MLSLCAASAVAFTPPTHVPQRTGIARRELFSQAAGFALAMTPLAALADGANSKATVDKARAIYGSRVYRLQSADAATIIEEKGAIKLFISGAYRAGPNGNAGDRATSKLLSGFEKKAVSAAQKGDSSGAQAAIKELVKLADIKERDGKDGAYNPKQRRNAGAPPTSEIVAQMATYSYSLYEPLKN